MSATGLPEVPAKYRAPARALFDNLAARLGSKAAADFVGESMIPFVQVATGIAPPLSVARAMAAEIIADLYSDSSADEPKPKPEQPKPAPKSNDFDGIKTFRNSQDCRNWPVTVQISNVRFRGKNIQWDEAKGQREARKWNVKQGSKAVNGEAILLIPSRGEAGMFDFVRVGQTDKILSNLYPGHEGPGFFAPWVPKSGERCGFCIATISRDKNHAKMKERSNVVWFTWP